MPCKEVQNFKEDLKSGKKALYEINTYKVSDHFPNELKSAAPYTPFVGTATYGNGITTKHNVCSILSELDISCEYPLTSYNEDIKLLIDKDSIPAKIEKMIIKALSDSKKCLTSFDAFKCIYTAIMEPSAVDNNKLTECKDTYNISDISPYAEFFAHAIVARAQYLDIKPIHDELLDSSSIAEECFICSSEVAKELLPTTHNDNTAIATTAENSEL